METTRELPEWADSTIIMKKKDEYFPVAGSMSN